VIKGKRKGLACPTKNRIELGLGKRRKRQRAARHFYPDEKREKRKKKKTVEKPPKKRGPAALRRWEKGKGLALHPGSQKKNRKGHPSLLKSK